MVRIALANAAFLARLPPARSPAWMFDSVAGPKLPTVPRRSMDSRALPNHLPPLAITVPTICGRSARSRARYAEPLCVRLELLPDQPSQRRACLRLPSSHQTSSPVRQPGPSLFLPSATAPSSRLSPGSTAGTTAATSISHPVLHIPHCAHHSPKRVTSTGWVIQVVPYLRCMFLTVLVSPIHCPAQRASCFLLGHQRPRNLPDGIVLRGLNRPMSKLIGLIGSIRSGSQLPP
jgi:hypothetical protein